MKKLIILNILIINAHLQAQLLTKLDEFTTTLLNLEASLITTPAPAIQQPLSSWSVFVQENERRRAHALANKYADFGGNVQITAKSQFHTLQATQQLLKKENETCVHFYPESQMHITLLYMHFPFPPNTVTDEFAMTGSLNDYLARLLESNIPFLKSRTFQAEGITILGKDKNFLVALYKPEQSITEYQQFIEKSAQTIFRDYAYAWFEFIEPITFHISLGKLLPHCTTANMRIPLNLPRIDTFQLKKGNLRVSIKGPNSKPYFKQVSGW